MPVIDARQLNNRVGILMAAVFALAAAVYANSLTGGFVYDDHPIIVENALVRGRAPLSEIFASSYWQRGEIVSDQQRHGGLYRPLTMWSYALSWRWGGGKAFYFHLGNVLLHGLAAVLLLQVMRLLGFSLEAAGFGALAFAVLPIHVEAVAWSVGRAEILGAVFLLAAWLFLHEQEDRAKIGLGLACYGAALLSKESAASFPAVLILGEMFRRRGTLAELARRRFLTWLSVFGVLIFYLVWRNGILGSTFVVGKPYFAAQSRAIVFLTMAKFLVRGWIWPMATGLGLCADYSRPGFPDATISDFIAWTALAAVFVLASGAIVSFFRKKSAWAFGVLVFFVLAGPLLNVVVPMEIIGAERIMYIPSIAFCLLIANAWDALSKSKPRPAGMRAASAALLVWWSTFAILRNRIWHSDETFFRAAADSSPGNTRVLTGLGMIADQEGRHAEARGFYQKALEVEPGYVQAAYDMGKSYYQEGDLPRAKYWFLMLNQKFGDKDSACFLGLIAERDGQYREALDYYARALERDPMHLEARRDLGLLLFKLGHVPEAIEQLRLYLKSGPPEEDAAEIERFMARVSAASRRR